MITTLASGKLLRLCYDAAHLTAPTANTAHDSAARHLPYLWYFTTSAVHYANPFQP